MNLKNFIDCHTHTNFSPDGNNTVEEMCDKAVELGLSAYAITDHCECGTWFEEKYYDQLGIVKSEDPFVTYDYCDLFFKSMDNFSRLKEKYKGKLNLIAGIELGQATQGWEGAEIATTNANLDFVIGSLHMIKGMDDFGFMKYDNMSAREISLLLESYFEEMLEMTQWGKFDVLGHITYPLRYIEGSAGISVDMKPFEEIIRQIFKTAIYNGKGIEVNSSGLRQLYGKTFPDLNLLKIYKDVGGEIITTGSDAHCVDDLGKGIVEATQLIHDVGFKYLTFFKERKPNFITIK